MSWVIVSVFILVGLALSAFFSGAEMGLYCVNRLRLHLGVQQKTRAAVRLARVLSDEQGALSVTLVGTNLSNYVVTTAVAYLFTDMLRLSQIDAQLYTVFLLTPIVFVFCEVVPKNLVQLYADNLMLRGSALLATADRFFRLTGVVFFIRHIASAINRLTGTATARRRSVEPKQRVAMMLRDAIAGDTLSEDRSDLIDRVCRLSETPLRAVLLPYPRVTVIAASADRTELLRVARATGYARLPVHGANRSKIVGVVKIDELLRRDDWKQIGECLIPALTFGPGDNVATAIAKMRAQRRGMAIVTGGGGHLQGIVTLRDLLQEIVG